eukprot:CAMPEP_0201187210 /NCGR_PEP_ID=MMETSP0851-20130426/132902_1 /ASSEMBLY_ACC=CAM_ASM_000631 /TAXON_ID=183588 /ORGANISM="Pseudo-nitzschia fraudulenta, Strain WWA7" /LENGTH=708 /DNA_ID=CAMNT_0047472645 /DNA_START=152 /DNA_END=2278 /DNA_ORIENTATION=+
MKKSKSVDFGRTIARGNQNTPHHTTGASRFSREVFSNFRGDEMNHSDGFNGCNGKNDHITPLMEKLYHDEILDGSYRPTGSAKVDPNSLDLNIHRQQEYVDEARRWSVGRISLLVLILFTMVDVFIHMVDAQIESLEAHDHYDALSADVIRPAFRYRHDQPRPVSSQKTRPSMGLGSAAISSVTTTLSPILPFTGGLDLRREDYWTNGLFGSISSVVEQVRDAYQGSSTRFQDENDGSVGDVLAVPRGGAAVASKTRAGNKPKTKKKSRSSSSSTKQDFILSSSDCFVPLKDIAESTLRDITMSFRYSVESTRRDFNSANFLSGILPRVKKMIERVFLTTTLARGDGIVAPITGDRKNNPSIVPSGDIDAINFCAAMRIFAEWRVLRQVPPGYKGYAVGIGLGQKDIVQNIAKIEYAIHDYIDQNTGTMISPTLRDLLQYEVDTDLHDNTKLPRLKEKSAAMGLLWVRRQLVYQTEVFNNVLDVPTRFESSRAAVQAAYDEVYGDLHGWAVQKIFSYSFQAAPEGIEIYKYMNPHRLEEVQLEAKSKIMGMPLGQKRKFGGLGQLDNNPIGKFGRHIGKELNKIANNVGNEWDKLSHNVVNEWDKVAGNIGQLFGQQRQQQDNRVKKRRQPLIAENIGEAVADEMDESVITDEDSLATRELEMETYIRKEMTIDAYDHIKAYLEIVDPLLDDLSTLIDEFNMDDPTKV